MNVERPSRQILIHGLLMVFAGLLCGVAVPHTPYPRLALGAHIQFVSMGILYTVMALLLLTLPHAVGGRSIIVMLLAVWLTWAMAFSALANAWWGTNQTLPLTARAAGVSGGLPWQEAIVTAAHVAAALAVLAAWGLLIVGFIRKPTPRGGR